MSRWHWSARSQSSGASPPASIAQSQRLAAAWFLLPLLTLPCERCSCVPRDTERPECPLATPRLLPSGPDRRSKQFDFPFLPLRSAGQYSAETENLRAIRSSRCRLRWWLSRDKPAAQLHRRSGIVPSAGSSPRGRGPPIGQPARAPRAPDYAHIHGPLLLSSAAPHESRFPAVAHRELLPAFPVQALLETKAHYCHLCPT